MNRFTLVTDGGALARLKGHVEGFAAAHALPGAETARLLIVLEELLTNVAKFGRPPDAPPPTAAVGLALADGVLSIAWEDDGIPFDPLAQARPDLDAGAEERPLGGLGLELVRALIDEARYEHAGGRNRLFLTRRVGPGGARPVD